MWGVGMFTFKCGSVVPNQIGRAGNSDIRVLVFPRCGNAVVREVLTDDR